MFNKIFPLKKSNYKKYSNIVLFEKKNNEEQKNKSASTRKFNPIKLYSKKLQHPQKTTFSLKMLFSSISPNFNQNQKTQEGYLSQTNTNLTQLSTNTMITSILDNIKSLSDSQLKQIKNINNNSILKTENKKNILSLKKRLKNKFNSFNKNSINKELKSIKCKTCSNFNDCQLLYDIYNSNKISYSEKKKKEYSKKKLIFGKINQAHLNNYTEIFNSQKQLDKTRDLMLIKYSTCIKKECVIRTKEINDNNMERVTDSIKSLQKAKKLYDIKFLDKLSEYVKFIFSRKEFESKQSISMRKEIIKLKKTNYHLNNKIHKLELEKLNLIRWLYLQIKIKEKKLELPKYYKDIIEDNENHKIIKKKLFSREYTFKKKPSKSIESNENNNIKNNINKNNIEISKEEYFRILKYKQNLVFKTPEELDERLKMFQNENLKLIGIYNKLQDELIILRNKYNEELTNQEEYESFEKKYIEGEEKELNHVKKHTEYLRKIIKEYQTREQKLLEVKNKNNPEKTLKLNTNQIKLYTRIEKLYLDCKNIKITGIDIKIDRSRFISGNKRMRSKEDEIIKMMEFIELTVGSLLNLFNYYNNPKYENYEIMKKIKSQIDKHHKVEKAVLFRSEVNNKFIKLREEINKRNNKIIFLQRRKMDLYKDELNDKKNIHIYHNKKKYAPTFEDFMQGKIFKVEEKNNKTAKNNLHSRSKTQ